MEELREERQAIAPMTPTAPVAPIAPAAPVTSTAPPAPQYRPFDLDTETSGKQPIEDDQETLLAEPITR